MKSRYPVALLMLSAVLSASPLSASELKIVAAGDIRSFIPAGNTGPDTHTPILNVYEGLTAWTSNGAVAPMLAEQLPRISEDGLTYTFELREGVKFHDGTSLTADAVVKSWEFLLEPDTAWNCRAYFDGSGNVEIEGITATGPLEVEFKLAAPANEFLVQMTRADCAAGGIMAPAFVDAGGKSERPIGTGPYEVTEINAGRYFVLTRFEDYSAREEPADGWAGRKEASIDTVRFVVIADVAASYAAMITKEVDLWYAIDKRYAQRLADTSGIVVTSASVPSINSLPINSTHGVLSSPELRRAMNYALNRDEMIKALMDGHATSNSSIIPASSEYFDIATRNQFTYDLELARELIAKSGYDGEVIKITTNNNWAVMHDTGIMVQAYLHAVGINAELEVLDFASQLPKYYTGEYDLMTFNYAPTLDPALIVDRVAGLRAENPSKVWNNAEARDLADKLIATPASERRGIYEKLHALYMEDPDLLIWATQEVTYAAGERVQGVEAWAGYHPRLWAVSLD